MLDNKNNKIFELKHVYILNFVDRDNIKISHKHMNIIGNNKINAKFWTPNSMFFHEFPTQRKFKTYSSQDI